MADTYDATNECWIPSPEDFASSNFRPVQIDNMHTGTRVQHKRYEPEELARLEHNRAIAAAKQAER